jgi:hypothetical protein
MSSYRGSYLVRLIAFLVIAAVGATILVVIAPNFTIWSSLAGLILLLTLYRLDSEEGNMYGNHRNIDVSYGATYALITLLIVAPVVVEMYALLGIWFVATVVFTIARRFDLFFVLGES